MLRRRDEFSRPFKNDQEEISANFQVGKAVKEIPSS